MLKESTPVKLILPYSSLLLLTLGFLFLIKYFNISYPVTVSTKSLPQNLSIVGEGKVDVTPDTAYVTAGISVTAQPTVAAAQDAINNTNNKIIAAIKGLGIDAADIKTSNYSITPNQVYTSGQTQTNGYNGSASLTIKVKDIELVSQVTSQATQAGANEISGVQFTVENPEKYREQARTEAINNAKDQAQNIASELGIHLGKVVNIAESQPSTPIPVVQAQGLRADTAAAPAQFEPGTQTITSTVTLYFDNN